MQKHLWIVLGLVLILAVFFLGRLTNTPERSVTGETRAVRDPLAPTTPDSGTASLSAAAQRPDTAGPAHPVPAPATQTTATAASAVQSRPSPDVPVSASAPGPQPLEDADSGPLAKAQRAIMAEGGVGRDLLELSRREPRDTKGRQLEALISQTILRKGGRYTGLRLSPPYCTRSVCVMRAVGDGGASINPASDWQRLSGVISSEPWFRNAFDDVRVVVGGDGPNAVYVSLNQRCEPGACRFGNR